MTVESPIENRILSSRFDDVDELGFKRSTANQEAIDVRLFRKLLTVPSIHRACKDADE